MCNGESQDDHVGEDVGYGIAKVEGPRVDAGGGDGAVPVPVYRNAGEDGDKDNRCEPG